MSRNSLKVTSPMLRHRFIVVLALLSALVAGQHVAEACTSRAIPKPRTPSPPPPQSASSFATGTQTTSTAGGGAVSTTTMMRAASIRTTGGSSSSAVTSTTTTTKTTTSTTTTTTTPRPNITFPTYKCPATYDAWYCLNDATCFSVKIGDSIMYNCECASGFIGPRCEFKELDGSYLPKRPRPMLEKASIASGGTCAMLFVFFVCFTLYLRYDQRTKLSQLEDEDDDFGCDLNDNCRTCAAAVAKCRFCNVKGCCSDKDLIAVAQKYRLRQHIEAIPFSFAIKRSAKL